MYKHIADRLADALESGKHPQGRGWLNRKGDMCCLGVLNVLAVEDGIIPPPDIDYEDVAAYDRNSILPSVTVQEWAGMQSPDGVYNRGNGSQRSLADDNDRAGYDFPRIASVIREHYAEL